MIFRTRAASLECNVTLSCSDMTILILPLGFALSWHFGHFHRSIGGLIDLSSEILYQLYRLQATIFLR